MSTEPKLVKRGYRSSGRDVWHETPNCVTLSNVHTLVEKPDDVIENMGLRPCAKCVLSDYPRYVRRSHGGQKREVYHVFEDCPWSGSNLMAKPEDVIERMDVRLCERCAAMFRAGQRP